MTDNLRNRIAAVVQQALISEVRERQDYVNGPYFDTDDEGEDVGDSLIGIDGSVTPAKVADAVIEALGPIPDREFTDPWGHRWEWCGGVTGTWAWRITKLEQP